MIKQHIIISCDAEGCINRYVEEVNTHTGQQIFCPYLPNGWHRIEHEVRDKHDFQHYCPMHSVEISVTVKDI